jgi:hypothetical protein
MGNTGAWFQHQAADATNRNMGSDTVFVDDHKGSIQDIKPTVFDEDD